MYGRDALLHSSSADPSLAPEPPYAVGVAKKEKGEKKTQQWCAGSWQASIFMTW